MGSSGRSGNAHARPDHSFDEALRAAFEPAAEREGRRRLRRLAGRWRATLRRLAPLGAVSYGNVVRRYDDGDELCEELWRAIDAARERVLVSTYILAPDRVGRATMAALARAAARGCAVRLRFDAVGSPRVMCPELDELLRCGATVEEFNPVLTWRSRLSRKLVRDHRKVVVVDGSVAFCGGMNFTEDYAGERHGNGQFRDTHLRLRGPVAADLEVLFDDDDDDDGATVPRVRSATAPGEESPAVGPAPVEQGALVQVLEANRWRARRAIQGAMLRTISRAGERVWLTSPYFVPPRRLSRAIRNAAKRGVDVRLLTAGVSDVPLARAIGRHLYARFLKAGVRIFELQGRTLHAKTEVIDGVYSSVGSFNLDVLSDRYNHEVNVGVLGPALAAELEADFERDTAAGREVRADEPDARSLFEKALGAIGYRLSKLL